MVAPPRPVKVVLADDNTVLTSVLGRLLNFEPDIECVGCVAEPSDVVQQVVRLNPQVLVIDLAMPGGDTPAIVGELRAIAPGLRIIVFSGFTDDERIERSLAAGASRFVCKDADPRQLVDAIRAVGSEPIPASA